MQNISCHSPAARGSASLRSWRLCTEHRLVLLRPQLQPLLPGEYSSRQRRMALPAVSRMTPLVNMLASGRAGLSCMVVVERMVSTTPQTSSTRALSSSTRQSEKPPLFRKLSSCFSSTSRARRQSVVPTASRHSPDRLLVLYSRMMPPIPQHRMAFLGSWNHQSSTCSSKIFLWMWSASAGVRGLLSSASSGMVSSWVKTEVAQMNLQPYSKWRTLLCFPHRSPVCWRTDQPHVFPGNLHVLWGNPSLPQGRVSPT
uniref:Uncharacterized protein n=1 Tax=Cyanoderma ruficeps TaxID=181631 RepID=A0A8C3R5C3_9PASS